MFKKIYVEITNNCNLSCSFCVKNNRIKEFITIDKFNIILKKLKGYTNYLYFHLMGEALLHPNINELIDMASKSYKVNITTNGYLINKIKDNKNINQLNISLHSFNTLYNKTLDEYLNNIFESIDMLLKNNTIISLRMWTNNSNEFDILNRLEKRYNIKINGNTKLDNNLYLEFDDEFIWPDINNSYYNEEGSCQGLRTHIGILVDGSVVPCCLDYNGLLSLGNIYKDDLKDILNSFKYQNMLNSFLINKKVEELCKHCNFYDRIINRKK
ncbi:MAG: SPASM domain-containing protein [Bacilli bacterium]|nr:SPASM domain-containing protein [Bacilli bacterium]